MDGFIKILLTASLLMGGYAYGDEDFGCSLGERPEWVRSIPVSMEVPLRSAEDPSIYNHLLDFQVHLDRGEEYVHIVKALMTPEAVQQESTIEIELDPACESLTLHQLCVFRDQVCIDKIPASRKAVIQPEENIENYQYTGRRIWLIMLEDVQAGDVLELSYTRSGHHPVFDQLYSDEFYLQTLCPLRHGAFRVIGSQDRTIHFKPHHTSLQPTHQILPDGMQEWSWDVHDADPIRLDPSTPSWYIGIPLLQASACSDWSEIAMWGSQVFALSGNYSSEMGQMAAQWKQQSPSMDQAVIQALRFVQKEIRYLGIESGPYTHQPADPNQTFQRRYGDCKDKTLLLKALLALMDIHSEPVLVSSFLKGRLEDWHPAISLFDHVILQIRLNDLILWVDPTDSTQECSSLQQSGCYLYPKGLVLEEASIGLSEMPQCEVPPRIVAKTTIHLDSPGKPALLQTNVTYWGAEADQMRSIYRQWGLKEIEYYLSDYYAEFYGLIESESPLSIEEDPDEGTFVLAQSYLLQEPWRKDPETGHHYLSVLPKHIFESIDFNVNPKRRSPLAIDHPEQIIEIFTILSKEDEWPQIKSQKTLQGEAHSFNYEKESQGNALHVKFELGTKKDFVSVEGMREHRNFLQGVEESLRLTLFHPIRANAGSSLAFLEKSHVPVLGLLTIGYGWICLMLMRRK